eukprot:CAMPEP_0170363264 /NCGR_PEP_ID=MMETSP0117_2-20130122/4766_1 /TAXON_ID=400756 /ORGANISM="Durinskia baltica, Strain CSIRO CS-38" /LENGTH=131 /DNA_ID=CAMNT_0010617723 /DNA_START=62 /DNA_END=457 /DNA_ORIENTATION=-
MEIIDYYEILEIEPDADYNEVKAAYHRLALKYHPDKSTDQQNDATAFRLVQEAWTVIGNEVSREEYDKLISDQDNLGANAEVVSLSEFSRSGDQFSKMCRCGSSYDVSQQDIYDGYTLVQCGGCSLIVRIE